MSVNHIETYTSLCIIVHCQNYPLYTLITSHLLDHYKLLLIIATPPSYTVIRLKARVLTSISTFTIRL